MTDIKANHSFISFSLEFQRHPKSSLSLAVCCHQQFLRRARCSRCGLAFLLLMLSEYWYVVVGTYKLIAKCVWFLISARTRSIIRCCLNVLQLEYCLNLVGIVSRASDLSAEANLSTPARFLRTSYMGLDTASSFHPT